MKKYSIIIVIALILAFTVSLSLVACGEKGNSGGGQGGSNPVALGTPTVTVSDTGSATWTAVDHASSYAVIIDNGSANTYVAPTYVQLADGQSIAVKAIGDGTNYSDGAWSNPVRYTAPGQGGPTVLDAPVLTISADGKATWTMVDHAEGYQLVIDGTDVRDFVSPTPVQLADGQTVSVRAMGDGTSYANSGWSSIQTYTAAHSLTKLATPVVSVGENGEVDWEAIPHASGYSIDVNGTVFAYEFDFFLMEGETVRVKALGDGVTYSDSDWSTAVTFSSQGSEPTKLATPQVTVSEQGVASWAAIANASGYKFKLNNGAEESTNALSVTLTSGQSIVVKAVGDGTSFSDSDWSASVAYTAGQSDTKLATPVVTINADGVASWAAVAHSWGYKYKVDGGEEQSTSARSVTLQGGQSIQVKAVGNGSTYTDSDWSQVKTYDAIPKLATPVVSIADDGTASWEAVEHATGYRYKISGGAEQFTSAFSVVLTDGQSIVVKAVFDGADYEESGWSAYTVYNAPVPTLATPEPYFASGCMGVLRWEAVEGAQSYKVHWYSTMWTAQERIDTRTNPSFCRVLATNEYCATDDNNPSSLEYYEYEVMALSDGTDCADSDWSTPVGFSVKAVGAIPSLRLDDAGLAAWDPILGALEYAVTVFGLDGLYIAEYVLPADQTTFQMTANTYICVSAGRWLDGSEALYYIPDFHFGYYLTLSGAKWRLRLSPNFIDGSDISYGSMEYRVNGGEILPFDGIGIFDLDAGDVVELRRVNTDNNWRSVTVAACAHTEYRFYPLVLPTEQSAGHRAYYQCVDCGATWEYGLDFLEAYLEKYPDNHYLWTDYTEYSDYQSMRNAIDYAWDAEASTDYKSVYSDTFRPLSHREETEWLYDADEHWTITYCRNCGEYEISAERSAHVMEGGVCTVCGYRSDLLLPADMSIEEFYSYNGALTINAYYEEEYDPSLYLDDYQWGRLSGLADYIVLYEGANAVLNNEPSAYMRGWVSWGDDEGNGGTYFDYSFLYKHTDQCGYPFHAVLSFDPNKLSALPGSLLDLKDVFRASATRATVISRNGLVLVVDGANYAAGVDSIEIVAGQEIAVGATAPIDYDMTPRKDVLGTLTWTSSDESILSIDQAGNMTAHREGTVTVRVETNPFNTYTDYAGYLQVYGFTLVSEATVTVKAELLPEALIARGSVTMTTKNPYPMSVSFAPAYSLDALTYRSSDESVATVDANGLVTAHAAGEAVITVTSASGLTATTRITVEVYDLVQKTQLDYTLAEFNEHQGWGDYTPLEGQLNLLVLPVRFPESSEYYDYDQIKADLEVAFFGSKEFNGYDTVKSYYETESMGKVTISGTVADWYEAPSYTRLMTSNRSNPLYETYGVADLACWAVAAYRQANAVDGVEPSLSEYDYDGDGVLDGVILIYAFRSRGEYVNNDPDDRTKVPDIFWPAVWSFERSSIFSGAADPERPTVGRTVMFASPAWMYGSSFTYGAVYTEEGYTVDSVTTWGDAFSAELLPDGSVSVTTGGETGFYWTYDATLKRRILPKVDGLVDGASRFERTGWISEEENEGGSATHGNGYHRYVDSSCFIHEMGHMFGLNDYYDTSVHDEQEGLSVTMSNIDGGFNMQDLNVGAHDPYSKLLFGWIDPYIITDECTIEINPIESSGDVILLSATSLAGNSAFDEYLLIELYTPTGLNEFDSQYYDAEYDLQGAQTAGCRIWHVDARIMDAYKRLLENGVIGDGDVVHYATSNTWNEGAYPELYELMLLRKNAAEDEDAYWMQHALANGGALDGDIFKSQEIVSVLMKTLEWMNGEYVEYDNNTYQTSLNEIILALGQDAVEQQLHTPYVDWSVVDSVGTLEAFMREYSWELFCRLLRSVDVDPEADWETILAELSEQNVDRINGKPYYGKNVMDWDFLVSDYDSKEDLQAMLYDNASSHVAEWLLNIEYDGSKDLQEICMELGAPLLAKELDKAREKNVYESSFSSDNLFVTGDVFTMERYAGAFYNPGLLDSGLGLGWEIHFDYVDGERAIITFTKTE